MKSDRLVYAVLTGLVLILLAGMYGAVGCKPTPAPTPSPSIEPTAEPTPTPTPCLPPGEDGQWLVVETRPVERLLDVFSAEELIGNVCGATPVFSLQRLASQLREDGLCAGRMEDSVFVQRTDGAWEEMHAVAFTTGCWVLGSRTYKGTWVHP